MVCTWDEFIELCLAAYVVLSVLFITLLFIRARQDRKREAEARSDSRSEHMLYH